MVSFLMPQDALRRYAEFHSCSFADFLEEMASVVEDEQWGSEYHYLRMYLYFTFYFQLVRRGPDKGLVETAHFSWFNTGLQTKDTLDDVYVCFRPDSQGWRYECLTWKGCKNRRYDQYCGIDGVAPQYVPPYLCSDELIWDARLDISWASNFDHIYGANLNRILTSKSFRNHLCEIAIPQKYQEQIDKNYDVKVDNLEEDKRTSFYGQIFDLFRISIDRARAMARHNYKWVLPIYYPRNRSMSFALPLFLNTKGNAKEPDIALVCTKRTDNGEYYDARTILEGYMVYENARQICKPYPEWLGRLLDDEYLGRVTSTGPVYGIIESNTKRRLKFLMNVNQVIAGAVRVGDIVRFEFVKEGGTWVAVNVRFALPGNDGSSRHRGREFRIENGKVSSGASSVRRGCGKRLEQQLHSVGRVTKVNPMWGFIRTEEGNDVWFSVIDNAPVGRLLRVGDRVVFECRENDKGYIGTNLEKYDDIDAEQGRDDPSYYDTDKYRSRPVDIDDYLAQRETRW